MIVLDTLLSAWPDILAGLALAIGVYASTNIDNLFLLASVAAGVDNRLALVRGFLLSSIVVLSLSAAFVAISGLFSPRALGLLGFVPIFIGVRILLNRQQEQDSMTLPVVRAWPVAAALLANSTDTIATFGPLLAESEPAALFAMLAGYILMAGLWIVLVLRLSERFARTAMPGRVVQLAMPIVMIFIGIYILLDTTTDTVVSGP